MSVVALLVAAGFFAAQPWIGCLSSHPLGFFAALRDDLFMLRTCTLGFWSVGVSPIAYPQTGLPGFNGPFWGSLIVGILYLAAAFYVARTSRHF